MMDAVIDSFSDRALALARAKGIARARDFIAAGIPPVYLRRLCNSGQLIQLARGLYQVPEIAGTHAEHTLAEAARLMPRGTICLASALSHHGLTTQLPHSVWVTLPQKARAPKSAPFPVEVVYAEEPALSSNIERVLIEGVSVPIYDVPKTIADCFKYRRRIGLDVAIEALREGIRSRKATASEIMIAAKIDRMTNVIRPYVEALS